MSWLISAWASAPGWERIAMLAAGLVAVGCAVCGFVWLVVIVSDWLDQRAIKKARLARRGAHVRLIQGGLPLDVSGIERKGRR